MVHAERAKHLLEDLKLLPKNKKRKPADKSKTGNPKARPRTLAERLAKVKGQAPGLPADASVNHDYHFNGAPKKQ
jgi:hypothetical protein